MKIRDGLSRVFYGGNRTNVCQRGFVLKKFHLQSLVSDMVYPSPWWSSLTSSFSPEVGEATPLQGVTSHLVTPKSCQNLLKLFRIFKARKSFVELTTKRDKKTVHCTGSGDCLQVQVISIVPHYRGAMYLYGAKFSREVRD